jgi:hypothetical protein
LFDTLDRDTAGIFAACLPPNAIGDDGDRDLIAARARRWRDEIRALILHLFARLAGVGLDDCDEFSYRTVRGHCWFSSSMTEMALCW